LEFIANISAVYGVVGDVAADDVQALVVPQTIIPASKTFAPAGVPVLHTQVVVALSGIVAPGADATLPDPNYTPSTPLVVTILPTSNKVLVDGSLIPMREKDISIPLIAAPIIPGPPPVPYPVTFQVTIVNGGQQKAKAE
jgi:hypothetical protein